MRDASARVMRVVDQGRQGGRGSGPGMASVAMEAAAADGNPARFEEMPDPKRPCQTPIPDVPAPRIAPTIRMDACGKLAA
jgi:hypothetical protein